MDTTKQVQKLYKVVFIPYCTNILGKSMNLVILFPVMCK